MTDNFYRLLLTSTVAKVKPKKCFKSLYFITTLTPLLTYGCFLGNSHACTLPFSMGLTLAVRYSCMIQVLYNYEYVPYKQASAPLIATCFPREFFGPTIRTVDCTLLAPLGKWVVLSQMMILRARFVANMRTVV